MTREITVRDRKVAKWYYIDGKILEDIFNETFQIVEIGR